MQSRRSLLKGILASAGLAAVGLRAPTVDAANYRGKVFVFVQADGGWDPTVFCDPKANTPGEPIINHWAETDEVQVAGGIAYAPFADNRSFFEKHHRRMLVVNGVDFQTNSHTVGITHGWSGRNARGYPTLTALLAAHFAPEAAVPYLTFGGFSDTGGVIRYTRVSEIGALPNIAAPAQKPGSRDYTPPPYIDAESWRELRRRAQDRAEWLKRADGLMPADALHRQYFAASLNSVASLASFADALPADGLEAAEQLPVDNNLTFWSNLRRNAQLAVIAFRTGVAVSADLWLGNFDTHADNDTRQAVLLANLTRSVDYLWNYAEEQGIADRLVVVMGSDFGRTNFYNADDGKDHWPIGSYVIMAENQPWTNRVVAGSDDLHFAVPVNPRTLARDDANGVIIHPNHVHKALRRYLRIENSPAARRFPFEGTEDLAFFG